MPVRGSSGPASFPVIWSGVPPALDVEIAGRPDQVCQALFGDTVQSLWGSYPLPLQVGDGPLHVPPVGVLGQDRPDTDLEGGICRPPGAGTIDIKELMKEAVEIVRYLLIHG